MKSKSSIVALVLLVLAIVVYTGVISPMSVSLIKRNSELTDEQIKLSAIEMAVTQQPNMKGSIANLEKTNAAYRAAWIAPMLNSYAMRVKSFVDSIATESGLTNVEYEEGDFRTLPIPPEQVPVNRTARRSVRIKATADYAAAVSFLMRAEKELPLMTLQALEIKPKVGDNEAQDVVFTVEWPCEGEVIK